MARFEEKEVKAVVWDCGSAKSSGLDGLNFKFIKEFRDVIKTDLLFFWMNSISMEYFRKETMHHSKL